jgi:hypothetical protein
LAEALAAAVMEVLEAEEVFQDNPEDLAVAAEDKTFLLKQAVTEQLTKETLEDQEVDFTQTLEVAMAAEKVLLEHNKVAEAEKPTILQAHLFIIVQVVTEIKTQVKDLQRKVVCL